MSDWVKLVVMVVLVVGGLGLFLYLEREPNKPSEFPDPSELASLGVIDEDWSVTDLDGKELRIGDLRGKVLFINIWGTNCLPCIMEMPGIQALYESLDDSVAFLIVSLEKPDKVRETVQRKGWSLPVYVASEGLPPALRCLYVPTTFIVNRKGQVVHREQGGMDWNTDDARNFLKNIP